MRPERLELEGFTAFRNRTVVDFTDSELFALSGPTGAGKSSLIDAIVFVLYGTIPRLADRRRVGPVISQGKVEARLGLDFSVGASRYRAVRVVRTTPSGTASTKEARLERRHDDGTVELLAGDADELTRTVEGLLGLTYDHFTTAVVLPQGEFARFLHYRPADRQALLKELLDLGLYDRLQQRANQHSALAAERARFARSRLEELADATEERAQRMRSDRAAVDELLARCEAALPTLADLAGQLENAAALAKAARHDATTVRSLNKPDGIDALASSHERAGIALSELEAQRDPLAEELGRLEAELLALPPGRDSETAIEAHQQLERQQAKVRQGDAALAAARQGLQDSAVALEAATATAEAADAALQAARTAEAAAALAGHLHPGDDCPVCGQVIVTLPRAKPNGLAGPTKAHKAAGAALGAAEKAHRAAEVELARVDAKLAIERDALAELAARVEAGPSLEQARRQLAAVQELTETCASARRRLAEHAKRTDAVRAELQRSVEAQRQAWTAFDAARDRVARLGPPAAERQDLGRDWDRLLAWAATTELEVLRSAAEAEATREQLAARGRAITEELLGRALGVVTAAERAGDVAALRDRALADRARLDSELERLDADRARAAAAQRELDASTEDEQVATMLTQLLRANRFGAWILDEAVQQLVDGATGLLQRLSGGAYSLVLDGKDFAVIDHNNADARRSARTLSGGETFLASLALALSLADQVVTLAGPTAAPLESLFLDEGFGTLDPDTLDTVATAIEELGSQGRMVGLVTHVRELAERLPVRFEVSKGPDGATVERILA